MLVLFVRQASFARQRVHFTQSVRLVLSVEAGLQDRRCVVLVPSIMQMVRLAHSLVDNVLRGLLVAQGQYALRVTRVQLPINSTQSVRLVLTVRAGLQDRRCVAVVPSIMLLVRLAHSLVDNVHWEQLVAQGQYALRATLAH